MTGKLARARRWKIDQCQSVFGTVRSAARRPAGAGFFDL